MPQPTTGARHPFHAMPSEERMAILTTLGHRFEKACEAYPVLSTRVNHDRVVIGYGNKGLVSMESQKQTLFADTHPQDITDKAAADMVREALPDTDRMLTDIEAAAEKNRILKGLLACAVENNEWAEARSTLMYLESCSQWLNALRTTLSAILKEG